MLNLFQELVLGLVLTLAVAGILISIAAFIEVVIFELRGDDDFYH